MPLKNDWQNGDLFTPAAANDMANVVNAFGPPTATGQAVVTAANAAAARAAIGASSTVIAAANISDSTSVGRAVLTAADAAAARSAISALGPGDSNSYSATLGNGSSTSIAITHNLGTLNVLVSVHEVSSGLEIDCDVVKTSSSVVTLGFATAPALNSLRCTVIGTAFGADRNAVEVSAGIPLVNDEKHTVCDDDENASWLAFTATGGIPWRTRLLIAQATGRTIMTADDPTAYIPAGFGFLRWERLAVDGSEVIDILEGVF